MAYDDSELKRFAGYFEAKEPGRKERAQAWATAIGLQKVDGLTPSDYLLETAQQHIEGKLTQAQVRRRINNYYSAKNELSAQVVASEEADKVSERIVAVIHDGGFSYTPEYFISLHKKLFKGILAHAGELRRVNIKKREWVLKDDSVTYGDKASLMASLARHFSDEKEFAYAGRSPRAIIPHFVRFIAQIWQIHPFAEGNTRTTAVFAIKYLHALGYPVTNNIFCENSWYFRNALVRANYADYAKGVTREWGYLEAFFRNLLLGEQNVLKSRALLIGCGAKVPRFGDKKVRIGDEKVRMGGKKVRMEAFWAGLGVSRPTRQNIEKLYDEFGLEEAFGEAIVAAKCGLSRRGASRLIALMRKNKMIEHRSGLGPGKYVFHGIE